MIKKLNRVCPICSNEQGEVLHAQMFLLDDNNPLPEEYDVVCCMQCRFIYADVDATQEDYNKYYNTCYKQLDSNSSSLNKIGSRFKKNAEDIINLLPNKTSAILDIGAGEGQILSILRENGYNNLYAFEPSLACVKLMKENSIIAYNIGIFDKLDTVINQKFDLIILCNVLEHLYDLKEAILNIRSVLSESGKVYIEVPNSNQYFNYYKTPYYYFELEHINHFCTHSLNTLMANFGFENTFTDERSMENGITIVYPVSVGLFEFTSSSNAIIKYIKKSELDSIFNDTLTNLIKTQEECAVWGIGNFTRRLLIQTNLLKCNIKYLVDKDKNKHGHIIKNIEIVDISLIRNFTGTIIVCSAVFGVEIVNEIKNCGYTNKVIVLG